MDLQSADTYNMPVTELVPISTRQKSLSDYAAEYLATFLNKNTRASYAGDLRHFLKETGGNLSDESLLVYREILIRSSSPRTAGRRLVAVSGLLDSLVFKRALSRNLYASMKNLCPKVDKHDSPTEALTDEEVRQILAQAGAGTPQRMALILSFYLGLRRSEICSIEIPHITSTHLRILGKGNKVRKLHLDETVMAEIRSYLSATGRSEVTDGFLLASRESGNGQRRVSPNRVNEWFKEVARAAGIDRPITTHWGRATAITKLLDEEASLRDVGNFAGHSSSETTLLYDKRRRDISSRVTGKVRY